MESANSCRQSPSRSNRRRKKTFARIEPMIYAAKDSRMIWDSQKNIFASVSIIIYHLTSIIIYHLTSIIIYSGEKVDGANFWNAPSIDHLSDGMFCAIICNEFGVRCFLKNITLDCAIYRLSMVITAFHL